MNLRENSQRNLQESSGISEDPQNFSRKPKEIYRNPQRTSGILEKAESYPQGSSRIFEKTASGIFRNPKESSGIPTDPRILEDPQKFLRKPKEIFRNLQRILGILEKTESYPQESSRIFEKTERNLQESSGILRNLQESARIQGFSRILRSSRES